jgi:hypothetical protein
MNHEVEKSKSVMEIFILVNTNFNHVNGFTPVQNLFQTTAGDEARRPSDGPPRA